LSGRTFLILVTLLYHFFINNMYTPPQSEVPEEGLISRQPSTASKSSHSFKSHFRSFSHQHPAPFAYEYVFEDGKIPFLAELHPVKKSDLRSSQASSQRSSSHNLNSTNTSTMQRQTSLKRKERHLHFDIPMGIPTMQDFGINTDKLKRALSLSGPKSHQAQNLHPLDTSMGNAPQRSNSTHSAPPLVVPTLVLPTPPSSPDLSKEQEHMRISLHSGSMQSRSSGYRNTNFSLPRSSWASSTDEEDQLDLQFIREAAQGRFSSNPTPHYGMRRNKALQILGITEMPMTPPYTPAHSASPSIYDPQSRINSRRTSFENRYAHFMKDDSHLPMYTSAHSYMQPSPHEPLTPTSSIDKPITPTTKPSTPSSENTPQDGTGHQMTDNDITPRPRRFYGVQPSISVEDYGLPPTPPPRARPQASKFTEHLNDTPILQQAVLALQPRPSLKAERSGSTVSIDSEFSSLLPESRRLSVASNLVCTAEAQTVVAMGSAKLIA
jgi:hypothetical protein